MVLRELGAIEFWGGWREAWELGAGARRNAAAHLTRVTAHDGSTAISVVNGLARRREGMARGYTQLPLPP